MTTAPHGTARAMPWVFVVIWSTGFVVARLGMPDEEAPKGLTRLGVLLLGLPRRVVGQ